MIHSFNLPLYRHRGCPIIVTLQYGTSLEKVGDFSAHVKFASCEPMPGHDRLK
jgi:hypothetical protein